MLRNAAVVLIVSAFLFSPSLTAAQNFSGSGPAASAPFALPVGAVIVEMEHDGNGEFRARLMDRGGTVVEELARVSGRFAGSRAIQVSGGEGYLLDVSSSGPWRIRFRLPVSDAEDTRSAEADEARARGAAAASTPGTWGWFGTGVLAGAVSGPVGGIVVTRFAGRDPGLPDDLRNPYPGSPAPGAVFEDAFRDALRRRRQRSAVRGSVLGTAILGFAIIRYSDLGRRSGEPGEPPPPLFQFMGGFTVTR